jgi:hypothetical protein
MGAGAMASLWPSVSRASDSDPLLPPGQTWDEGDGLVEAHGGAFVSSLPRSAQVHFTRESLDYATALLADDGSRASRQRAFRIIEKVLTFQESNPQSPRFGSWPYYKEEPLAKMKYPDDNWADFMGARLGELLLDQGLVIPAPLKTKMRRALSSACQGIIRRDVQPSYTNIAIMAAGVTLMGGRILSRHDFSAYGANVLTKLVKYTAEQGSFNEYNSPTYTFTALTGLEEILNYIATPTVRANAQKLRMVAWSMIANHYHPATGEWAGPHSRAYWDRLTDATKAQIALRTGLPLPPKDIPPLPPRNRIIACPPQLLDRFRRLPKDEATTRQLYVKNADPRNDVVGTTWLTDGACLGSASFGSFWEQAHPLIAYWRGVTKAAVFRVRALKDGRDCASIGIRTAQSDGAALLAIGLLAGKGDTHPSLDRSPNGFPGKELALAFTVDADDAEVRQSPSGAFELVSGRWKAIVHPGPALYDGARAPGTWRVTRQPGFAEARYTIPLGGRLWPEQAGTTLLATAVQVLNADVDGQSSEFKSTDLSGGWRRVEWNGLRIDACTFAT